MKGKIRQSMEILDDKSFPLSESHFPFAFNITSRLFRSSRFGI